MNICITKIKWAVALILLWCAGAASVRAEDQKECWGIVLSDEAPGYLITRMVQAGYGSYNLYDALVVVQACSDPSVAGVITDNFLNTLAHCPAGSAIFKDQMKDCVGGAFAISTDGTVEARDIRGSGFDGQLEANTLESVFCCVTHDIRLTYTKNSHIPLTSWQASGPTGEVTNYCVFAIVWAGPGLAVLGSGDLNWDDRVDVADAIVLGCLLARKQGVYGCILAGDMNLDGEVNQLDLAALTALLAGD